MRNQKSFLSGYSVLKIPILDADGIPAWNEKFPLEKIAAIRESVGARHFQSQMLLEPLSLERARLNPELLKFYNEEFDRRTAKLGEHLITGFSFYWDPSAAKKTSDGSVCVFLLRDDKNRRAFIHDCIYLATDENDDSPLSSQCRKILEFMEWRNLRHIAVEVNGIGNALPEIMRTESRDIHIRKIVSRENKQQRILDAVEPPLTTARLFAHERIRQTPLIDEMNDWSPVGFMKDDGLDALAGALRLQPVPIRPAAHRARPLAAKTEFKV